MKKVLSVFLSVLSLLFFSCSKSDVKITSIIYNDDIEWFREAVTGMQDAAKKYRVEFKNYNSYYDLDSEIKIAEDAAKDGTNAVVFCPLDYKKSSQAVEILKEKGIPVITWNTMVDVPVDSKILVDSTLLGSKTGSYLAKYFEKNNLTDVKTALITNYTYTVSEERCNGFKNSIRSLLKNRQMEIIHEVSCELTEETKRNVKILLDEHKDLQLIWCWNQTTLEATLETLKSLNRMDILLCGTDLSSSLAKEMLNRKSNLIAVTTQQPYQMGYSAVENAIISYCGETVEETVVIPVITYTADEKDALKKYLNSFKVTE